MLALSPSPSLTAQKHHRQHAHHLSVQPRSSSYRFGPGPAQELSPEAAAIANAQKSWPGQPLCDDVWLPNSSVQSPWGWGPVIDPGRFTPLPDLPQGPETRGVSDESQGKTETRAKEKQTRQQDRPSTNSSSCALHENEGRLWFSATLPTETVQVRRLGCSTDRCCSRRRSYSRPPPLSMHRQSGGDRRKCLQLSMTRLGIGIQALRNKIGGPCCDTADGFPVEVDGWDMAGTVDDTSAMGQWEASNARSGYRVRLADGKWQTCRISR